MSKRKRRDVYRCLMLELDPESEASVAEHRTLFSRKVLDRIRRGELDIHARNDMGTSTVSTAAMLGMNAEIEELVAMGADLHHKSTTGALSTAVYHQRDSTVELLLALGAGPDDNLLCNTRRALLCDRLTVPMARMLLSHGASLGSPEVGDLTPLDVACDACHPDVARVLIESGADVNTSRYSPSVLGILGRLSASSIATNRDYDEWVALCLAAGATFLDPIEWP